MGGSGCSSSTASGGGRTFLASLTRPSSSCLLTWSVPARLTARLLVAGQSYQLFGVSDTKVLKLRPDLLNLTQSRSLERGNVQVQWMSGEGGHHVLVNITGSITSLCHDRSLLVRVGPRKLLRTSCSPGGLSMCPGRECTEAVLAGVDLLRQCCRDPGASAACAVLTRRLISSTETPSSPAKVCMPSEEAAIPTTCSAVVIHLAASLFTWVFVHPGNLVRGMPSCEDMSFRLLCVGNV